MARIHTHNGQRHEILGLGDGSGDEIAFCLSCGTESDGEHCPSCCGGRLLGCDEYPCRSRLESEIAFAKANGGSTVWHRYGRFDRKVPAHAEVVAQ